MGETVFRVTSRIERPFVWIIKAEAVSPHRKFNMYLDKETRKPLYPMSILGGVFDLEIKLISDKDALCKFPPSLPASQIHPLIGHLNLFDETVAAARKLMKEEQRRLGGTVMLQAPLTFRLYQSVKFNRPVDKEIDIISPGGYEIKVQDEDGSEKTIAFDFEDYEGSVDGDDKTVVHCIQKNPDYTSFEDLNLLNEHMLRNIISVEEWFIYTGEAADLAEGMEPLKPVEILNPVFEIIPENGDSIRIPVTASITPGCNF